MNWIGGLCGFKGVGRYNFEESLEWSCFNFINVIIEKLTTLGYSEAFR